MDERIFNTLLVDLKKIGKLSKGFCNNEDQEISKKMIELNELTKKCYKQLERERSTERYNSKKDSSFEPPYDHFPKEPKIKFE